MCDITEGKSDITLTSLKSTDNTLKSTDMRKSKDPVFRLGMSENIMHIFLLFP